MTYICLLIFILLGYGVAFVMARKSKSQNITIVQNQTDRIDVEDLVTRVAKAVAKEVVGEIVEKLPKAQVVYQESPHEQSNKISIEMDMDKVIPMAIDAVAVETSLEGMAKEEEMVDKGLQKSKSKLAEILKRKKE